MTCFLLWFFFFLFPIFLVNSQCFFLSLSAGTSVGPPPSRSSSPPTQHTLRDDRVQTGFFGDTPRAASSAIFNIPNESHFISFGSFSSPHSALGSSPSRGGRERDPDEVGGPVGCLGRLRSVGDHLGLSFGGRKHTRGKQREAVASHLHLPSLLISKAP